MKPCTIQFERQIAKFSEECHLQRNFLRQGRVIFFLLTWERINQIPQLHIPEDYKLRQDFKPYIEDKFKKKPKKRVILCPLFPQEYAPLCVLCCHKNTPNFFLYCHQFTLIYVSFITIRILPIFVLYCHKNTPNFSSLLPKEYTPLLVLYYHKITPNFCPILPQ